MRNDSRKNGYRQEDVEAFIEEVVAPARTAPTSDAEAARARDELAREERELARRELREVGFDVERLDKLAAEGSEKRKKLAEETRRKAIDASVEVGRHLADIAPVILPIEPLETVIDQVAVIRSFIDQGTLVDWNVGPSDNWARYRFESSKGSYGVPGRLSFFTIWQNRRNSPTTVKARANLVVNAHLSCEAYGNGPSSWMGVTSQARATVRVRTTVWNMDSSISSIVHDQDLETAVARGHFFGDDSSRSIGLNELLPASGVLVAPQSYSLIEVELLTEWQALHGLVTFDAEGGSHRVDLPSLILTEIQTPEPPPPPPITLVATVNYDTSPATVTLNWSGATTTEVDVYMQGVKTADPLNDGSWSITRNPGTYVFRVCEAGSNVCSNDVSVTVNQ